MAGRTLYLHIGNHAVGTAAILAALRQSGEQLAAAGLAHHEAGPAGSQDFPAWLQPCPDGDGLQPGQPGALAEQLAAVPAAPVVSCADLACIYCLDDLAVLQQNLARHFNEIRLIAYLLRQDEQSLALNNMQAEESRRCIDQGSRALLPETAKNRLYLDYHGRLARWVQVFGQQNLTIRAVDRKTATPAAIATDFFAWLGLPPPIGELPAEPRPAGRLQRLIATGDFRNKRMLQALVAGEPGHTAGLPARSEAMACVAHYQEGNRQLAATYAAQPSPTLFADDFSAYPEDAADLWNEASANASLQHLFAGIAGSLGRLSHEELLEIAKTIAPRQAASAHKLRRIARLLASHEENTDPEASESST